MGSEVKNMRGISRKLWCFGKNKGNEKEMSVWIGASVCEMREAGVDGIAPLIPDCAVFQEDFSFEWRELKLCFGPEDVCFVEIQPQ